jgi:hypothetical protein
VFLIVPTSHTNTHAHTHAYTHKHAYIQIGLARTIYIQCIFSVFAGNPPKIWCSYTVMANPTYPRTCTHTKTHIHSHTHKHAHTDTCTYTQTRTHTDTHKHTHTCTQTHTNTQTHIQTINEYVHIFTQIHSYVTSDMRDAKKSRDSEELTRLRLQNQRLAAGAI